MYDIRLTSLPVRERPASRLALVGAASLSERELLSVLIGGKDALNSAVALLGSYDSLNKISQATEKELRRVRGIGPVAARRILAALALNTRAKEQEKRPSIGGTGDAADIAMSTLSCLDHEEFWVAELDTRGGIMGFHMLYKGSLNMSTIRPGEVFRAAIKMQAAALIIYHNHPSGNPHPSKEDLELTGGIVMIGQLMGIDVLDHIIIGDSRYHSIRAHNKEMWS